MTQIRVENRCVEVKKVEPALKMKPIEQNLFDGFHFYTDVPGTE